MNLIILSVVFLMISCLFSVLGMGGGILYLPVLLFAGFSFEQAPPISLILILATSSSALFTFWRNRKVDWKLALLLDPPTDIMAFAGGYCSSLLPELALKLCLAAVLIVAGILMLKKPGISSTSHVQPEWYRWRRHFNDVDYSVNVPLVLTATALIGVLSGMLGITGGIIKLPVMVLLCGVPMDVAVATSTVMVTVTALSGLAGHSVNGNVLWGPGLMLASVSVLGGLIGSRISLRVNKNRLKQVFGVVIILIAVKFIVEIF